MKIYCKGAYYFEFNFIFLFTETLSPKRDNGYIHETRKVDNLVEHFNYDCIGNESVIKDCPTNSDTCPSSNDFEGRTELTCKGKKQLFSHFELRKIKKGVLLYLTDMPKQMLKV